MLSLKMVQLLLFAFLWATKAYSGNSLLEKYCSLHLDGIMHKWANPHFDDFEKNRAAQ